MIKISDSIRSILSGSPFLSFGFNERLFNLSSLARYLQKPLETKLQKDVQVSAIKMNLSRIQQQDELLSYDKDIFQVQNISVQNNLATLTYPLTPKNEEIIRELEGTLAKQQESLAITQSSSEITLFCPKDKTQWIQEHMIHSEPKYIHQHLSALKVQFSEKTAHASGMIYFLLQKLMSQGVSIVEISSTYTECIFFMDTHDIKDAFNILHLSFLDS